jgi:hypothetical protein
MAARANGKSNDDARPSAAGAADDGVAHRRDVAGDGTRTVTLTLDYDLDGVLEARDIAVSVPEHFTDELARDLSAALNTHLQTADNMQSNAARYVYDEYRSGPTSVGLIEEYADDTGWQLKAAISVETYVNGSLGVMGNSRTNTVSLSDLLPGKFDRLGPKSATKN